jgi:tyrosyl-tRNA synthetase
MDVETKLGLIRSFAQEILTEEELRSLFETNAHPLAYDGFEPSGLAPIHFGLLRAKTLKTMFKTGIRFNLYLADYFALINNKMGGDINKIRDVGRYFVEVWKAAGIDTEKINIVWCKDLMQDFAYWDRFIRVGKAISLDRAKRAITIMGRKEGGSGEAAQIFYPAMQVTDIFQMDIDICQLGMDQRKANVLAREVAHKYKWKVPVAVHHPYLLGLKGAPKDIKTMSDAEGMSFKMSKSDPNSSILVHDSKAEIRKKINSAYCPEKVTDGNPMFDYLGKIILDDTNIPIMIDRPQKFGGPIEASNFADLERLYKEGKVHPMDLKAYVASELEKQIAPIREYFERDKKAKELYETVKKYQITR